MIIIDLVDGSGRPELSAVVPSGAGNAELGELIREALSDAAAEGLRVQVRTTQTPGTSPGAPPIERSMTMADETRASETRNPVKEWIAEHEAAAADRLRKD